MNKTTTVVLVIVFITLFLLLIYQQTEIEHLKFSQLNPSAYPTVNSTPIPSTTSSPTTAATATPEIPPGFVEVSSASVTTKLLVSQQNANLVISGNVTNNTPNTLSNLGLHVYSWGYPLYQTTRETILETIIPIASGTVNTTNHTLTTMSPYETLTVQIVIPADYGSRAITLYGNEVTVVQAT